MKFARLCRITAAAAVVALLAACAHPISLEATKLPERDETKLVAKKVGYVLSDANRSLEVTTAGGGGDKVSYYPYRDMEKALRAALRSVYQDVSVLKSGTDAAAIADAGVAFVFTPVITTASSSPSPFTWPPTLFTVDIQCTATDPNGAVITTLRASGQGAAEFDEFKSDHSLSARRAAGDTAANLAQQIRAEARLR